MHIGNAPPFFPAAKFQILHYYGHAIFSLINPTKQQSG